MRNIRSVTASRTCGRSISDKLSDPIRLLSHADVGCPFGQISVFAEGVPSPHYSNCYSLTHMPLHYSPYPQNIWLLKDWYRCQHCDRLHRYDDISNQLSFCYVNHIENLRRALRDMPFDRVPPSSPDNGVNADVNRVSGD